MTTLLVLAASLVWAGTAGAALNGTDVSHWQGTVDWLRVSNAGYSFAFLKATEGATITDPTYPINRDGAGTLGIRTGAYHFARPAGSGDAAIVASAIAQADRYVDVAGLVPGDLPPALDLEATGGLAPAALTLWTQTWLDEVTARTGAMAVVYFSPNFWKAALADTTAFAAEGYRLWIAHWKVTAPTVPGANWGGVGWTFWQWTNCETIPGVFHCVDGDRFNGTSLASVVVPALPAAAPAPAAAPTVVGTPQVGKVVAAVPGSWNGGRPISFVYQWQSCDAAGGGCVPIPGAAGETYTPAAGDAGHALVVSVTAQNASGAVTVVSPPSLAVATGTGGAAAPVATTPPTVTGTAQAGQALTASVGTWSGSPTSFALQWRRCDAAGASCAAIPLATAPVYTTTPDDIGATLSLLVIATGKGGSRTAASTPTAAVAAAPVPAAVVGSAVAQAGAAGAVTTADNALTATWQPGAVPAGATVSLAATAAKLALRGTAFALGATAPLAWPVDVQYASAPAGAVPGLAAAGGIWQSLPELTTAALSAEQPAGVYHDAAGALHVLTRVPGTFALFAPGKWGDPRRIAAGPPVLERLAPVVVRGRADGTFLVTTRVSLASQAHLYAGLGAATLLQTGSRLGPWLHGRATKTVQSLVLAPGGVPVRLRVPARFLHRHATYRLRIAAVDPYGRKASLVLAVRR